MTRQLSHLSSIAQGLFTKGRQGAGCHHPLATAGHLFPWAGGTRQPAASSTWTQRAGWKELSRRICDLLQREVAPPHGPTVEKWGTQTQPLSPLPFWQCWPLAEHSGELETGSPLTSGPLGGESLEGQRKAPIAAGSHVPVSRRGVVQVPSAGHVPGPLSALQLC